MSRLYSLSNQNVFWLHQKIIKNNIKLKYVFINAISGCFFFTIGLNSCDVAMCTLKNGVLNNMGNVSHFLGTIPSSFDSWFYQFYFFDIWFRFFWFFLFLKSSFKNCILCFWKRKKYFWSTNIKNKILLRNFYAKTKHKKNLYCLQFGYRKWNNNWTSMK